MIQLDGGDVEDRALHLDGYRSQACNKLAGIRIAKKNVNMYSVPAMNGWPSVTDKVIVLSESLHEKDEFQEMDSFFSRAGMEPIK